MKKLSEVPELTSNTVVHITKKEDLDVFLQFLAANNIKPYCKIPEKLGYCFLLTDYICSYGSKPYFEETGRTVITFEQFLELVKEEKEEKYTVAECREQRISIKVSNEEERKIVAEELGKILGENVVFGGNCLRVYKDLSVENDDFGSASLFNYLSSSLPNIKSTKEINFNQLILTKMQDLDKPLAIIGKPKLIESICEDLKEIGYSVPESTWGSNYLVSVENLSNLACIVVNTGMNFWEDKKLFNLPQDYVAALEFAKAQIEHLKKDKTIKVRGVDFTIVKDGSVEVNYGDGRVNYTKEIFSEKLEILFQNRIGSHKVEEVKIGCTTFTRSDYQQLLKFLN